MKPNDRAVPASIPTASGDHAPERGIEPITPAASEITIKQRVELSLAATRGRSHAGEASPVRGGGAAKPTGTHTLVLIGELDHASTHTLEAEIERLCAAGVGAITLDLSKLSGIDSAGVAVIAFRSRWCRKRGCELSLIPGPRPVQRAFALAGVLHALAFREEGTADI